MSGQGPANPRDWEKEIDALLEGALNGAEVEALKAAATADTELANAIAEAWRLQDTLDQLRLERAPVSLRRKLRRIPRRYGKAARSRVWVFPRWVVAGGLTTVALLAFAMMMSNPPNSLFLDNSEATCSTRATTSRS